MQEVKNIGAMLGKEGEKGKRYKEAKERKIMFKISTNRKMFAKIEYS